MDWKLSLPGKLVYWLIYQVPGSYLRLMTNVPLAIIEVFGLKVHGKYLFVPMFHDTSWLGRGLSIFFRIAILFSGSLLWGIITLGTWLLIPGLFILPLLGIAINVWFWWIWFGLIGVVFIWRITRIDQPWGKLGETYQDRDVLLALPGNISQLVSEYPSNLEDWWDDEMVRFWFKRMGADVSFPKEHTPPQQVEGPSLEGREKLLKTIFKLSQQAKTNYPEIGEVMCALYEIDEGIKQAFSKMNIAYDNVQELARWLRQEINWYRTYPIWDERYQVKELAGTNRALTSTPTPTLDLFSYDLTLHADRLPEAVNREHALEQVLKILSRQGNQHVMIIGDTGCGKTTFVGGLAQTIMRGNAPRQIANHRLVKLEPGRLVAGTRTQGELTSRMVTSLQEIKKSGDLILFIDEIHTLLTAQETVGGLNLFAVLEEALAERDVQLIGATSIANYKKYIEPNEAFTRLFEVVKLNEPDDKQALMILENITAVLESKHQVIISLPAIQTAIKLSRRYIHDRVLPDKAKGLLDEASLDVKNQDAVVKPEDVAKVVTRLTGIPVSALGKEEKTKLLNLEKELHKKYVNQELAVTALANALRRGRLDISNQQRPVGTFMFVGPTGVGKTELARRLSEVYFGSESAMIRLDMSEFATDHMVRRLVGAAPGESGYGEGGELTERVRRQPSSLILLDEIEKAHPQIWDLLMQVIDEGRLTDAAGLTVDFTNTIIIATSNAVTLFITEQLTQDKKLDAIQPQVFDELLKTFHIEFLNRFDGIVPFGPLNDDQMEEVVKIQLDRLSARLAEKKVKVKYTPELIRQLAKQGTDTRLGARPLLRLIQDKIESHLARVLLEREGEKKMEVTLGEEILE